MQLAISTSATITVSAPEPAYVRKVREENAKPIPFPESYKIQLSLFGEPALAPVKKPRKKKVRAASTGAVRLSEEKHAQII